LNLTHIKRAFALSVIDGTVTTGRESYETQFENAGLCHPDFAATRYLCPGRIRAGQSGRNDEPGTDSANAAEHGSNEPDHAADAECDDQRRTPTPAAGTYGAHAGTPADYARVRNGSRHDGPGRGNDGARHGNERPGPRHGQPKSWSGPDEESGAWQQRSGNAARQPGHDRRSAAAAHGTTDGPDAVDDGTNASESAPGKPVTPKTNQRRE